MNPAKLFRLLSEFLMFLLGGLLVLLAFTGRVGRPARPAAFILLGAVLVYWGLRGPLGLGGHRRPSPPAGSGDSAPAKPSEPRFLQIVQAVSLSVLGAAVLGISLAGVRYTAWLLAVAGASLVVRGLLASVYLVRRA